MADTKRPGLTEALLLVLVILGASALTYYMVANNSHKGDELVAGKKEAVQGDKQDSEIAKALSKLNDSVVLLNGKIDSLPDRISKAAPPEPSRQQGQEALQLQEAVVDGLKNTIESLKQQIEDLTAQRDDPSNSEEKKKEINEQIESLKAEVQKLTDHQDDAQNKLKSIADKVSGWQDHKPTDEEKKATGDELGGLLKVPGDLIQKLFELPAKLLQSIFGLLGQLFGLGGTEYQNQLDNVTTKVLTGQPVTPEDVQKLMETLKANDGVKVAVLDSLDSLAQQLEKNESTKQSAGSLRQAAVDQRNGIEKKLPSEIKSLENYLKQKSEGQLADVTVKDLILIVAPGGTFASKTTKNLALGILRNPRYKVVYKNCWNTPDGLASLKTRSGGN